MSKVLFQIGPFGKRILKLKVIQILNKSVKTDWFCFYCFVLNISLQFFSQKKLCYGIVSKLTNIVFGEFHLFQYNILSYSVLTFIILI